MTMFLARVAAMFLACVVAMSRICVEPILQAHVMDRY